MLSKLDSNFQVKCPFHIFLLRPMIDPALDVYHLLEIVLLAGFSFPCSIILSSLFLLA